MAFLHTKESLFVYTLFEVTIWSNCLGGLTEKSRKFYKILKIPAVLFG